MKCIYCKDICLSGIDPSDRIYTCTHKDIKIIFHSSLKLDVQLDTSVNPIETFFNNKDWHMMQFETVYKDNNYRASFIFGEDNSIAINNRFRLDRVIYINNELTSYHVVAYLPFHPNITPDNFLNKLPTLIVFG